jgi:hypothetical protein
LAEEIICWVKLFICVTHQNTVSRHLTIRCINDWGFIIFESNVIVREHHESPRSTHFSPYQELNVNRLEWDKFDVEVTACKMAQVGTPPKENLLRPGIFRPDIRGVAE